MSISVTTHPNFSEQITAALTVPDFDGRKGQHSMAMAGRLVNRLPSREGEPRVGAVMLLLYPINDVLHVVYTKRPDSMRNHSGQISFPGGRLDAGETLQEAALRELWEEVGVSAETLTVLGQLTQMYIMPSDFLVHPFVAYTPQRPEFVLNPDEVETLLEVPLAQLLDPITRQEEDRTFPLFNNRTISVPFYAIDHHKIWGATAIITGEFIERWRAAHAP